MREYTSSEHSVTVENEERYKAAEVSKYTNNEWLAFTEARQGCQTWILLKSVLSSFHRDF